MANLATALAEILIGYTAKTVFGDGLKADMVEATGLSLLEKLIPGKSRALGRDAKALASAVANDLRAALLIEGADTAEAGDIETLLAGALGRMNGARALVDAAFDAEVLATTIRAALDPMGAKAVRGAMLGHGVTGLATRLGAVGTKLAGYANASEAKKLTALRDLAGEMAQVKAGVARVEEGVETLLTRAEQARAEYAVLYRAQAAKAMDYVEILGLSDVDRGAREAKLSTAYLSLTLQGGGASESFKTIFLNSAFKNNRCIIEGGAGSGKSTIFRKGVFYVKQIRGYSASIFKLAVRNYIMLTEVSNHEDTETISLFHNDDNDDRFKVIIENFDKTHPPQRFTPFLIRLRDFPGGEIPPMEDWPRLLCKTMPAPPDGFVHDALTTGRAVLFFDGVDEIPEGGPREKALGTIATYARTYPDIPILIASRPGAFDPKDYDGLHDAKIHTVDDMSAEQRAGFIRNWHAARAASHNAVEGAEYYDDLRDALVVRVGMIPALARIASNPLLCAAICALHENAPTDLPTDERSLCEKLTMMLLKRDGTPGQKSDPVVLKDFGAEYDLSAKNRRQLLAYVAHKMVTRGQSQLEQAEAAALMTRGLREIGAATLDPKTMIRALAERSPPLRPCSVGDGRAGVEFVHNRFKEWLASTWFVSEQAHAELIYHAEKDDYAETLVMAAAAPDQRKFADDLVTGIMDRAEAETNPARKRQLRVLALRASLAASPLSEETRAREKALQGKLLPPRSMAEASALSLAGNTVVDRLKQRPHLRSVAESTRCIRCLAEIGTKKAKGALETYREDTRKGVWPELLRVFDGGDVPALWAMDEQECIAPPQELRRFITRLPVLPEAVRELRLGAEMVGSTFHDAARITDASPLAGLTRLQMLDLRGTQVADVSALASLTGLQSLDLNGTQVVDVSALASLTGLQMLDLRGTQVADVSPLAGLTGLQSLYLRGAQVTDVLPLAGLTGLQMLFLNGTHVADVSPLAGLTGLQRLDLRGAQVTDLSPLAGLTGLQNLSLDNTKVADVSPLAGLTGLQGLDLDGTQVADVSPLAGLTRLQVLLLFGTPVIDLSPLDGIEGLTIHGP